MNRQQRRAAAKQTPRAAPPGEATVAGLLQAGVEQHRLGHLDVASTFYRQALSLQSEQPDALHLLGVIASGQGRYGESVDLISRAIARQGQNPLFFSNRGLSLKSLGQLEGALADFDQAVRLRPDFTEALSNRGKTLIALGRYDEAFASYDAALKLRPDFAEVLKSYAAALYQQQHLDRALHGYDRLIAITPGDAEASNDRGNVLFDLGRVVEALASYEHALSIAPHDVRALGNRGSALLRLNRLDEALATLERAIELSPELAELHNAYGNVLQQLNRREDALAAFDTAVKLRPDDAEAFSNRGIALQHLARFEEAVASFQSAIAIRPDYGDAHWNEAVLRLRVGDFENGWVKSEWRWQCRALGLIARDFAEPLWLGGDSLAGKTILLHSDQGLGDTIQFCRYAPMVAALGARVVLQVQPPLVTLLSGMAGVAQCLSTADSLPHFDVHCPLASLPLAFGTRLDSIPSPASYLSAPVAAGAAPFDGGDTDRLRVGIVWSGNPNHSNDRNRSIGLKTCLPLFDAPVTFVTLQTEMRAEDRAVLDERRDVVDLSKTFGNFADTAAVIAQLDLVVTVDTSVAHLAGALGCRVWILLPSFSDWRWLLDRDDSPWYASARLFRQSKAGDWDGVIADVRDELAKLAAARR